MRRFIPLACILAFAGAPAIAGDGQVSQQSLSRMGLAGMKVVPDREAMHIRGQSIAITFSFSTGTNILSIGSPISVGAHHAFSATVGVSGSTITGGFASASAH